MKCILCYIYSMRRSHFPITHETKATSLSKPEQRFQSKYLQHHEALIFLPIICCSQLNEIGILKVCTPLEEEPMNELSVPHQTDDFRRHAVQI